MQQCNRIGIPHSHRQDILADDAPRVNVAERAFRLSSIQSRTNSTEVRCISGPLIRVAAPTQGLKVSLVVPTPVATRNDVIYLQGLLMSRSAAQLAPEACP